MSYAATLPDQRSASPTASRWVVSALLALWFALVVGFSAAGAFVAPAGTPPLPLLATVLGPVVACLVAYRVSHVVRELALTADLRFLTAMHAWRFGGFAFLTLNAYGILPAYFAWPAGLGDMAIAATAPWMLAGLARHPGFAASRRFVTWNVLGILDLLLAVTLGAVVPLLFPGVAAAIPTDAMARLPLALIPGFFVPGYLIMHAIALAQARHAAAVPAPRWSRR
jgi:hypothetical protein